MLLLLFLGRPQIGGTSPPKYEGRPNWRTIKPEWIRSTTMCCSCYPDAELAHLQTLLHALKGVSMADDAEGDEGLELKDIGGYRSNIRAAVRALWNGYTDYNGFFDMMSSAIRRGLSDAWREGASECGIKMEELTAEERMELENMIFGQLAYIGGFAEAIEKGSKANGGKLAVQFSRSETWVNRYNEAKTRAAAKACANKKKQFKLGATEKHCKSCANLAERVYRYQTWEANGALPPSSRFECGGFLCDCRLVDTDQRITPGRFPVSLLGG
jgi:hypothetical protein